jgi:hypothetical protein
MTIDRRACIMHHLRRPVNAASIEIELYQPPILKKHGPEGALLPDASVLVEFEDCRS